MRSPRIRVNLYEKFRLYSAHKGGYADKKSGFLKELDSDLFTKEGS